MLLAAIASLIVVLLALLCAGCDLSCYSHRQR